MKSTSKTTNTPKLRFPEFTGDWEQCKLGEVVEMNPKSELPEEFEYVDLEAVIGTEMISHRTEYKNTAPSRAQRLAQIGDIFYQTVRPYQKNNYLFDIKDSDKYFVFSTGYAQLRPITDNYFLFSKIQEDNFVRKVLDKCTGTSYPAINANDLSNIEIQIPTEQTEQITIGNFFRQVDKLIALHQGQLDKVKTLKKGLLQKMFPAQGETVPQIRFPQFTDDWEQRKFGDVWQSTSVRNTNLEFGANDIISVAQMKLAPSENKSSDEYMKTYNILRVGDIAFEGNKSKKFAFGRFVLNDLQDGIVSHVFNVYRPCIEMDISFMKTYINNENVMRHILVKATTKTVMMTTLNAKDIVKQNIYLPTLAEQTTIGNFFRQFDDLINLHQRKLEHLKALKKSLLQQMFV